MDEEELHRALWAKLVGEAVEAAAAASTASPEVVIQLADMCEVMDALWKLTALTAKQC